MTQDTRGIEWKSGTVFHKPDPGAADVMLVTGAGAAETRGAEADRAVSDRSGGPGRQVVKVGEVIAARAASEGRAVLLVELRPSRRPPLALFSTSVSRGVREIVSARHRNLRPVAKGAYCYLGLDGSGGELSECLRELAEALPVAGLLVVVAGPGDFRALIDNDRFEPDSTVIRADLDRDRSVLALLTAELRSLGIGCRVWKHPVPRSSALLAAAGVSPGGRSAVTAGRIEQALAPRAASHPARAGSAAVTAERMKPRRRVATGGEEGQVLILSLGLVFLLMVSAAIIVALGGALTGKARAQRAADLSALSAARSLRDDLPRRLSPPVVNGAPNPFHMTRVEYLARGRMAAIRGAQANGVGPRRVTVRFPDLASPAPLRAEVRLRGALDVERSGGSNPVIVSATAEATLPVFSLSGAGGGSGSATATGGGYSGPLEVRQGKGMRPDTAAAFDLMSAAAAAAGHHLVVSSAFRSDTEQARLFAANPDPKWVAPPGQSLHRCATELDLGPSSAYGWLAANAPRFGFVLRYSWEPWHFGYAAGPEPCSAGDAVLAVAATGAGGAGGGDGRLTGAGGVPAFVPAQYRDLISRAAARWNVSAALLAAQLQAESNFDPTVVSHAGAQGIAQFMPGTAAAYGLADPFDPAQAIMAQAHLMSDLLRQFGGAAELALAAYNAGPGAVAPCNCIPPYAETIAYVGKIMTLLAGSGEGLAPPLEVRLVD